MDSCLFFCVLEPSFAPRAFFWRSRGSFFSSSSLIWVSQGLFRRGEVYYFKAVFFFLISFDIWARFSPFFFFMTQSWEAWWKIATLFFSLFLLFFPSFVNFFFFLGWFLGVFVSSAIRDRGIFFSSQVAPWRKGASTLRFSFFLQRSRSFEVYARGSFYIYTFWLLSNLFFPPFFSFLLPIAKLWFSSFSLFFFPWRS